MLIGFNWVNTHLTQLIIGWVWVDFATPNPHPLSISSFWFIFVYIFFCYLQRQENGHYVSDEDKANVITFFPSYLFLL